MTRKKRKSKTPKEKAAPEPAPSVSLEESSVSMEDKTAEVKEEDKAKKKTEKKKDEPGTVRELEEYKERLQRTAADFANYQKRSQRDIAEVRKYAASPVALDLLGVLDNLQRALEAAVGTIDDGYLQGFRMIEEQLREIFRKHGVEPIEALEQPFDPNVHDALMEVEDENRPDKTVVDEIQKGYMIHDRLLRPTRVRVSRKPAPPEPEEPEDPEGKEPQEDQKTET